MHHAYSFLYCIFECNTKRLRCNVFMKFISFDFIKRLQNDLTMNQNCKENSIEVFIQWHAYERERICLCEYVRAFLLGGECASTFVFKFYSIQSDLLSGNNNSINLAVFTSVFVIGFPEKPLETNQLIFYLCFSQ